MRSSKRWLFIEPVNGGACSLIVKPGKRPVVRHPNCRSMADVIIELDAFYCMKCHFGGRISGAWAAECAEVARQQARGHGAAAR